MVGMATFDLITAVPWIMSSSPIPRIVDGGDDSGVQGAFGNEGFCKAQSFLIMLGIGPSPRLVSLHLTPLVLN